MESTNVDLCLVRIACFYLQLHYVYEMCDNVILHFVKSHCIWKYMMYGSGISYLSRLKNFIVYILQESEVPF